MKRRNIAYLRVGGAGCKMRDYVCGARIGDRNTKAKNCDSSFVNAEEIGGSVQLVLMIELMKNPKKLFKQMKQTASIKTRIKQANDRLTTLNNLIKQAERGKDRLLDFYMRGKWTEKEVETKRAEWDGSLENYQQKKTELENQLIDLKGKKEQFDQLEEAEEKIRKFDRNITRKVLFRMTVAEKRNFIRNFLAGGSVQIR